MAIFNYNPPNYNLPDLPKLNGASTPVPQQDIKNSFAKSILDTLGKNIKPVTAYSDKNNIENLLRPTQELGKQFIQQTLLPDFQERVFNPYQRNQANQTAGSNLSLMGNGQNFLKARTKEVVQPFLDQSQQVQDQFNQSAYQSANDFLKSYYDPQVNF